MTMPLAQAPRCKETCMFPDYLLFNKKNSLEINIFAPCKMKDRLS